MTATTTAMPTRTDGLHPVLPQDGLAGSLVARVWRPGALAGPAVVVLRPDGVFDLSRYFPTMSTLLETDGPFGIVDGRALEPHEVTTGLTPLAQAWGTDEAGVRRQLAANLSKLVTW